MSRGVTSVRRADTGLPASMHCTSKSAAFSPINVLL
jgi:hypothetical protein